MSALLDALGWVGESLDKPGRSVRGLLAGRPGELANLIPFSDTLGLTDPSRSVSGRGLLEQYGMLAPKEEREGFGWGDVAGMGVEAALDPTNLIGGGALKRLLGSRRIANASNEMRVRNMMFNKPVEELLAKGAMPEEVARLTKAVDEAGRPIRTFHGTPHVFDEFDMAKMDPEGLYGPGIYTTVDPNIANTYVSKGAAPSYEWSPNADEFLQARADALQGQLDEARKKWSSMPSGPEFDEAFERSKEIDDALLTVKNAQAVRQNPDWNKYLGDYLDELPELRNVIEEIPAPENVRSQFLDIRNPFDIEKRFTPEEADMIGGYLMAEAPPPGGYFRAGVRDITGQDIYNDLLKVLSDQESDDYAKLFQATGLNPSTSAKADLNQLLKSMGYDAIQHMGGGRAGGGNVMHQVYIALDPSQVYKPLVAPALRHVPDFMTAPRISPLLAALGLENVLARGSNQI